MPVTDRSPGLPFVKLSGAGNDFVAVRGEALTLEGEPLRHWVRAVCSRRTGVGADGVLIVESLAEPRRVRVRYLNADGSEAFCGNGTRCAARFASLQALAEFPMTLATAIGDVPAGQVDDRVRLELPAPRALGAVRLDRGGRPVSGWWIDSGVPHFVVRVDDVDAVPLDRWGPWLRRHERFGDDGVNVDLLAREGARWRIRTWERGVEGETLACGSGAVAAALALRLDGESLPAELLPAGGVPLRVALTGTGPSARASLEGEARVVYEGRLPDGVRAWTPLP